LSSMRDLAAGSKRSRSPRSRSVSPPSRMEASGSEDIDVTMGDNEGQPPKRQRERSVDR
jgi:hypothetical protein